MNEFRILAPTAVLGYGFPMASFEAGIERKPDLIAVDAGSTNPGPYYLGAGVSFTEYMAVKRDLTIIIRRALDLGIKVVIGSAGGSGGNPHLKWNLQIIQEIARSEALSFKLALIEAEFSKETVLTQWRAGKIAPLLPAPPLTEIEIEQTVRIVGQMGMEPIIRAFESPAQVCSWALLNPAVFAAPAVAKGFQPGLAVHLGKILECAAIAATPGSGSDCLFGYLTPDYFEVETLNPIRKCTTLSVAAHTLYEKSNPYLLPGPGGTLDLRETKFEASGDIG